MKDHEKRSNGGVSIGRKRFRAGDDTAGRKPVGVLLRARTPQPSPRSLIQKNQELESVIQVVSHDLRSPLLNLQGFGDELSRACDQLLLAAGPPADRRAMPDEVLRSATREVKECVAYIKAGVRQIDCLLAVLSDYAHLGREALKFEHLDMNALLGGVAEGMRFRVRQTGARLQIGTLPACWGDPVRVNQVFSNLLDNALKYLDPARAGAISVTGRRRHGLAVYVVKDNGIGVPEAHQAKIFEMFQRADCSDRAGDGLGLAIARRILEQHNGRIRIESQVGKGTSFFVYLPAAPAAT